MTKMIIYFYLLIPLFLSIDSSSIRGRNLKNDLVPKANSRLDPVKKDSNSLKILSSEPFIVQLHIPKPEENEIKETKEKDKRRKQLAKKRVSKVKPMRKKYRNRRDLSTTKIRQDQPNQPESSPAVNATDHQFKNDTKNSINRVEILKALSLHSKKKELKRNKTKGMKNIKDDENSEKNKHNASTPNRNLHKPLIPQTDRTPHAKIAYPSTPKPDRIPHKYTYQDLVADRERIEQKIKYIKNMLNLNDSNTDDMVRVRRRSDSDRTADKIAKMFLTLSAVNGLHDKRKSRWAKNDGDDNDRVQDVWEREKKTSVNRRRSSLNEERYKVKKWIDFMKSKRSSGKTCPCLVSAPGEDGDAFPLEQKLPRDYYLMERERSSEESSESYRDSLYNIKEKPTRQNYRIQCQKAREEQENRLKSVKNGKKKLELPFDDLELYRSRAKQILRNAEEILDRIKEEEEKRLSAPNVLLSQLKELTSKIQSDPKNNENDLIRKLQKNFGWGPLAKPTDDGDKPNFTDHVKSFILDPYEKAKALKDESTKKLSSYLLRNLGKIQESSEEQKEKKTDDETQTYFEQVRQKEEQPQPDTLAKEDLKPDVLSKHKEDSRGKEHAASTDLGNEDEAASGDLKEQQYKQRMEDIIKEQQRKINDYKMTEDLENNSREVDSFNFKSLKDKIKTQKLKENTSEVSEPEKTSEYNKTKKPEIVESKKEDVSTTDEKVSSTSNKPFLDVKGKFRSEKGESDGTNSRTLQEEKELDTEIKEIIKAVNEKDSKEVKMKTEEKNDDIVENLDKENEKEPKMALEVLASNNKMNSKESDSKTKKTEDSDVVASPYFLSDEEDEFEASPRFIAALKDYLTYDDEKDMEQLTKFIETHEKLNEATVNEKQEKSRGDSTKTNLDEDLSASSQDSVGLKEPSEDATLPTQTGILKEKGTPESSQDETTQIEMGGEKVPEHADLVQEPNQKSKSYQPSDEQPEEKTQANLEIPKSERLNDDKDQTTEYLTERENPETEAAVDDKVGLTNSEEIVESYTNTAVENQKDMNEDPSLTANSENEKPSNKNLSLENQRDVSEKDENDVALKATKSEETTEEPTSDETAVGNTSGQDFDEEKLKAEKPIEEVNGSSSVENKDDSNEEKLLKSANDEKKNENLDETVLKAGINSQRDENEVGEETISETTEELDEKLRNKDEDDEVFRKNHLKATKPEEENDETENLKTAHDVLPKENDENEYVDEKAFLKSEKKVEDGNQGKNEKKESETLGETFAKETSEESDETVSVDSKANTDEEKDEATLKADNPANEASQEIPPRSVLTSQEQEELTEETSLRMAKTSEENSDEKSLKATLNNQEDENIEETDEKETPLRMEKEEMQEILDEKGSDETLKIPLKDKKEKNLEEKSSDILKETQDNQTESTEAADGNEPTSREEKNEVENETSEEKNSDEKLKEALNNQKENIEAAEDETTVKMPKPNDAEETSNETLKATLEDQREDDVHDGETVTAEDVQDPYEANSYYSGGDDTLKAVLDKETKENLNEESDKEILKEVKITEEPEKRQNGGDDETDSKANLRNQNSENVQKTNDSETLSQVNFNEEGGQGENKAVLDDQEQKFDDDDDIRFLRAENLSKDLNSQEADSDNLNLGEKTLQETHENSKEVGEKILDEKIPNDYEEDETSLKNADLENRVDDAADDVKTLVKSAKASEESGQLAFKKNEDESREYREQDSDGPNNLADQEIEDETLRSVHFDEMNKGSEESLYETLKAINLLDENLSDKKDHFEGTDTNSQDPRSELVPDPLQKDAFTTKHLKTGNLKLPKSIGKIMEDLDGKEKDDVTSLQNLNPDKIDHIIDKIDEAEQQSLLTSQEVDCRKECACADEIDTKSRNIGRYEIVKDFLHWMKDLQLNRVLSDN